MVFATVCSVDGRSVTLPGKAKKSGEQSTEAGNSGYRGGGGQGWIVYTRQGGILYGSHFGVASWNIMGCMGINIPTHFY